jgi:4-aminobutyrate aminotransferase / (S)-3-amino-2-methylpropionate transaminase / 5-aminovalerate transaminase
VDKSSVAAVITETFQGPTVVFLPPDYVQALRKWTAENQALLIFDEMQAAFGRMGTWFGFEYYGVEPDLICLGKGMTSSLPMSAVAGRGKILDRPDHGQMSSTHTGNPLCCAAAVANIHAIKADRLLENVRVLEPVALENFRRLKTRFPNHVGAINGKGLVWAVYLLDPASKQLNVELAKRVVTRCMELGLLMLQTGRGTLKIAPPLCISREAFTEGLNVIHQVMEELL